MYEPTEVIKYEAHVGDIVSVVIYLRTIMSICDE